MRITLEMLNYKKACPDQVELFQETFGDAVEVTQENCIKATKAGLDITWAANNLLSKQQRAAYEEAGVPLLAAYEEAKAPLLAAYEEARAPLWASYEEARAPAYKEAATHLYTTYEEARVPLWAAYKEARAIAFYNATKI